MKLILKRIKNAPWTVITKSIKADGESKIFRPIFQKEMSQSQEGRRSNFDVDRTGSFAGDLRSELFQYWSSHLFFHYAHIVAFLLFHLQIRKLKKKFKK